MIFHWIILGLFFLIAELGHPGAFLFLSFSIGAFIAFLGSIFTQNLLLQIFSFFLGSILGFMLLKSRSLKWAPKETKTNVEALIGKKPQSIKFLEKDIFEVKIEGQIWTARFENNYQIPLEEIIIKRIKGCHLIIGKRD